MTNETWTPAPEQPLPPLAHILGAPAERPAALTGMAWQGYYLDTEGNTFGLHQPDPQAK